MTREKQDPAIEEAVRLIDRASGASWYGDQLNRVDVAVTRLCRLRRLESSERASSEGGDAAVRRALEQAEPEAVIWLASRAISYMDEHGFPETVAGWLGHR